MGKVNYTGWPKGMDNVHDDTEIEADTLRRAVNVDVLDSGKLRRRKGSTLSLAATKPHSLWSDGKTGYFVEGSTLKRLTGAGAVSIGTIPANGNRLSYAQAGAATYFLSLSARGRISGGALGQWGIDLPLTPPSMMPDTGLLDPGTYHAVVTFLLADGRESGASTQASITLAAQGGITFYGLPVPTQADVVQKRIYLTTANGEVFYRAATVPAADTVATFEGYGAELRTRHLNPPPFGSCIAHTLGRMFIAKDNLVYFTEALDYDHVDMRKNFYQFPATVDLIAAVQDGLYVCADKTYFIPGAGAPNAEQKIVFDFGGIAGTAAVIPSTGDAIWFSERGSVTGKDGGVAEIVSEKLVAPGQMTEAAAMVREQGGIRQFVVVGNGGTSSSLQCGSYAEAEIIRRTQ